MLFLAERGVEVDTDCACFLALDGWFLILGGSFGTINGGRKSQKKTGKVEKQRKKSVVIFCVRGFSVAFSLAVSHR